METEFRAKEICELSGATKSQLSPWVAAGAIVPLRDDPRRGGVRVYSIRNLVEAMICKELAKYSFPVRSIAMTMAAMNDKSRNMASGFREVAWESLKKNPNLLFCVFQISSLNIESARNEKYYKELSEAIANSPKGRHATQWPYILKKEDILNVLSGVSSMIIIDLGLILYKAGICKK